jgi:hypothetical protein
LWSFSREHQGARAVTIAEALNIGGDGTLSP